MKTYYCPIRGRKLGEQMVQVIIEYEEYQELLKLKENKISKFPRELQQGPTAPGMGQPQLHAIVNKYDLEKWLKTNKFIHQECKLVIR